MVLSLLLLTGLLAGALVAAPAQATTRTISGRVVDVEGKGVYGITVQAHRYATSERQWWSDNGTTTDVAGNYTLKIRTGTYKLQFFANELVTGSYAPVWYGGTEVGAKAKTVKVSTGSVSDIGVSMKPGGVISGRIFLPNGEPLTTRTGVRAVPVTEHPDYVSEDWGNLWTPTQDGAYSIRGLRTGSYRIVVEPRSGPGALTWFGGSSYFNTATAVAVTGGEVVSGRDITLSTPGTMSGRVLHPKRANSKPRILVIISDRYGREITYFRTSSSWRWSFDRLAPADYYVSFQTDNVVGTRWYGSNGKRSGAKRVTVRSGATTTINNRLVYFSLKNKRRPHLSGKAKVGHRIKSAKDDTWNRKPTIRRYQWYRDGKAISGARKATYRVRSADAGHRLRVRVHVIRQPYERGSALSFRSSKVKR